MYYIYNRLKKNLKNIKYLSLYKIIISLIILIIIIMSTFSIWRFSQNYYTEKVSLLFNNMNKAIKNYNIDLANNICNNIEKNYTKTGHAQISALLLAKLLYKFNRIQEAKLHLKWAINNSVSNEFKQIAKLRLAHLFINENLYDQSLSLLKQKVFDEFSSIFLDTRGDIYFSIGKIKNAKEEYKKALSLLKKNDILLKKIITYKINIIG